MYVEDKCQECCCGSSGWKVQRKQMHLSHTALTKHSVHLSHELTEVPPVYVSHPKHCFGWSGAFHVTPLHLPAL